MHARGMDLAGAGRVGELGGLSSSAPAAVVHVLPQILGHRLDLRQHAGIAGAQIVFADTRALVALLPVHVAHRLKILHPAPHHREILLFPGGKQEQHRAPARLLVLRQHLGELADDLVGLRAVERPGLAVAPHHRDGDDHLSLALDLEADRAVAGFRLGDDVAEDLARVALLEDLAVEALDDLARLELAGLRGGRALLDIADDRREARLLDVEADSHRAEVLDVPRTGTVVGRVGVEDRLGGVAFLLTPQGSGGEDGTDGRESCRGLAVSEYHWC